MSEQLFESLTQEEWVEAGGGGSAERGLYTRTLVAFAGNGGRFARIPTDRGPFAGKRASSVSTALKGARDAKNAPESISQMVGDGDERKPAIKITSQGGNKEDGKPGVVYLENLLVAAE